MIDNYNGKNKEYFLAVIFIILTDIFWGISFISTKIILAELPPISIAFFRQLIALVPLVIYLGYKKAFSKMSLKDLGLVSLSGLFGIVLYFIFENTGLKYTTASNASMIVASVPIFTLFCEALFYKFRITQKMIFCLLLSVLGVYFVISVNGKLEFGSENFFGNALVIGAMVCWVIYVMLCRSLGAKHSGIVITAYQTLASAVLFVPLSIPEIKYWKNISMVPFINLVYLGLFCSALAYFFYNYAGKRLGATTCAAFLNLIPVVSVIASYIVLKETISFLQASGMVLIISSLYLLIIKPKSSDSIQEKKC